MRLRLEVQYHADEGTLDEQILEVTIRAYASLEEKQRECERFLREAEKLIKE